MKVIRLALLALLVQAVFAQQPTNFSLRGIVLNSADGEPIARANVELRRLDEGAAAYVVTSGDDGGFQFTGIQPGRYRVFATRTGFVPAEYGQPYPGGAGLLITIVPDKQLPTVRLAMAQTATILGRVSTLVGQPLVNAVVRVMRASYGPGGPSLSVVQSVRTNDLGEYRVFWLPPGQYYVSATVWDGDPAASMLVMNANVPRNGREGPNGTSFSLLPGDRPFPGFHSGDFRSETEAWPTTYYRSATTEAQALPIEVKAGATIRGIDMALSPLRPRRVSGTVIDAVTRRPVRGGQILQFRLPVTGKLPPADSIKTDGAFELRGVAPGSVMLIAMAASASRRPGEPAYDLSGRLTIDVADRDIDSVIFAVAQTVTLRGRVFIEGLPGDRPEEMSRLLIAFQDPIYQGLDHLEAEPEPDGRFEIRGIPPAEYQLTVGPFQRPLFDQAFVAAPPPPPLPPPPPPGGAPTGNADAPGRPQPPPLGLMARPPSMNDSDTLPTALRNAYVKSILMGNEDVSDGKLHVDERTAGALEIRIGMDGGIVEGRVSKVTNEPSVNASVVLIPSGSRSDRVNLIRAAHTDASGKFSIQGVMPGEYRLLAWEGLDDGAWYSPETRQTYAGEGISLRVEPRRTQSLEVRAILVPR